MSHFANIENLERAYEEYKEDLFRMMYQRDNSLLNEFGNKMDQTPEQYFILATNAEDQEKWIETLLHKFSQDNI